MTLRLKREYRDLTKAHFNVSDETLAATEVKAGLVFFPDGKGEFTGGYALEFWCPALQRPMGVVFPLECFEDDESDTEAKETDR